MTHPVGLCIGENDVFIRSLQRVNGNSMDFYCNILEGICNKPGKLTDLEQDVIKWHPDIGYKTVVLKCYRRAIVFLS